MGGFVPRPRCRACQSAGNRSAVVPSIFLPGHHGSSLRGPTGRGAPGHTAGCRSPRPGANSGCTIRQGIDHFPADRPCSDGSTTRRRIDHPRADRPPFGISKPAAERRARNGARRSASSATRYNRGRMEEPSRPKSYGARWHRVADLPPEAEGRGVGDYRDGVGQCPEARRDRASEGRPDLHRQLLAGATWRADRDVKRDR